MTVDTNFLGLILVAVISVGGTVYASRQSKKSSDSSTAVQAASVSQEAFQRARDADTTTINNLRADLTAERQMRHDDRLQMATEIERLQRSIDALRADLGQSHRENLTLREHIDRLEATVARLRARLTIAGDVIPEHD